MTAQLSPAVTDLLQKRERWRQLHQQGDHAGVERLLQESRVVELQKERLPASLPSDLDAKLSSYGREWERALALVAFHEGVDLAEITLHLTPSLVVQFQAVVEERLKKPHPWGALLFIESVLPLELSRDGWKACSYFLIARGADLATLDLRACPGVVSIDAETKVAV